MLNRKLTFVPPEHLAREWPALRTPLAAMHAADGWLPEDVYCAIKLGGASLYLLEVDGKRQGFVVLRVIHEIDGPRLHIWVLYADTRVDVMALFSDDIDAIARAAGASKVTFGTTRCGWQRVAPRYGFKRRETLYERNVQ
ncbi:MULTISPECIES: hypothetical protein [Mycetohabitans]|uniref:hypothetical protein n=1 Tax=Mycetohabitans TaxID=2571159 RepID=UPI001F44A399|nr:hypothetical protein [Mycetohabitans sp. B3]MCF2133870.1 hypothetical protein [Mycetohabitans sp. B3]